MGAARVQARVDKLVPATMPPTLSMSEARCRPQKVDAVRVVALDNEDFHSARRRIAGFAARIGPPKTGNLPNVFAKSTGFASRGRRFDLTIQQRMG